MPNVDGEQTDTFIALYICNECIWLALFTSTILYYLGAH